MLTAAQIFTNIVNQLKLLDPSVSAETGTPEAKIISAVAEQIASSQVDFTVLTQQNDLTSMTGSTLDSYLGNFGFGRQQATPSVGIVTFARSSASGTSVVIPLGTQLSATLQNSAITQLTFVTLQAATLDADAVSVDVPVQCTTPGSIGNVPANSVSSFAGLRAIIGISGITNKQATTGGTDGETDDEYRTRFQNTVFRNMAGTYDQFMALAVAQNSVTKANVVGPISRYQEYVQIPSADDTVQATNYDSGGTTWPHKRTTAESTIPYSKYAYGSNYFVTNGTLDPATAQFYRPGVDYVFNAPAWNGTTGAFDNSNPQIPNITFLATSDHGGDPTLVPGNVVLLEHAYMSQNSRNDYNFGIFNCIDVFVNGSNNQSASSVEVVPTSSNKLQNTNSSAWTYQKTTTTAVINFARLVDGSACTVGSLIQPLYWQPVVDLPDSIQVGAYTYFKANYFNQADSTYYNKFDGTNYTVKAHYAAIQEVNGNYGTIRSRNGIEWFTAGNNYLNGFQNGDTQATSSYTGAKIDTLTGTQFTVTNYTYDQNIPNLQAILEKNKQVATDVLAHKAKPRYFQPLITVMYTLGSTKAVVDASIIAALQTFFENQYFGAAIQLSDILQTIHNVAGVDNVRWTNPDTGQNKVQEVNADGSSKSTPKYFTTDFYLQDNELPASPNAKQVVITVRAANTWGT